MNSLLFLITRKAKNRFREFLRSPSQIITASAIALLIGFTFYTSTVSTPVHDARNPEELYAIIFALYTFAFVMTAKNGFINGASMFSMADVNLLFTAPFREKKILTFGLFQQLGKSLTLGFFILYQSATVTNVYGIKATALIPVLIGYGVVVFLSQMVAMVIYSLTCSDDKKCTAGKIIFYGIAGLFIGYVLFNTYTKGFSVENLVSSAREDIMKFFPVSGFVSLAVEGAITWNGKFIIIGVCCSLLFCALYFAVISKTNKDFYEDVLKATEVSFSAITARKEGKAPETAPRNIRTGKKGFTRGFGASAISQKHKIENRRSRVFLVSNTGLVMIGFSAAYTLIFPDDFIPLFAINIYTIAMGVCTGRWAKEFTYPYIYLIPEKPFIKLLHLIKRDLPSMALESILCFIPLIFLSGGSISEVLTMGVSRFAFGLMFIGVSLLLQRLLGDSQKTALALVVYSFLIMLFSAPVLAVGVFTGMMLPFNYSFAFIAMTLLCTAISFLLIFLCRNVLEYSEYNNR